MIATMTRTTTPTVQGGGAHAPAHPKSAQVAGAAPTTLTARLPRDPGAPGTPATPRTHGPRRYIIAAARASTAPRKPRTSQKVTQRNPARQQTAAPSRRCPEGNGSTTTPARNEGAQRLKMKTPPAAPREKGLCGKPLVARPLQQRAPQSLDKRPPSAALGSSQRKKPNLKIRR